MAKKDMVWKEEDGTRYKISFSEQLQRKNLQATRALAKWERRSFYAKLALIGLFLVMTASMVFVLYRLDSVNFFSTLMYK